MRLRRAVVTAAAVAACLVPLAITGPASAGTHGPWRHNAVAHPLDFTNQHITNYASGGWQGGDGHGNLVDGGTYNQFNGIEVGTVTNNGTASWPFDVGSGDNATYAGRPVWEFVETGSTSTCIQVAFVGVVLSQTCGYQHPGSYWVSTANAPNGKSGWHGLVSVYETNYGYETQSTQAQYMYIPGDGYQDDWTNYVYGAGDESYNF